MYGVNIIGHRLFINLGKQWSFIDGLRIYSINKQRIWYLDIPRSSIHDDVIKWKHFPRNWPFVRGIHRAPHKGQWRGALMFSLIYTWIRGWVNNREAGDLRRHQAHYDVIVMSYPVWYMALPDPLACHPLWHTERWLSVRLLTHFTLVLSHAQMTRNL